MVTIPSFWCSISMAVLNDQLVLPGDQNVSSTRLGGPHSQGAKKEEHFPLFRSILAA
jgi:hypothetical protein